MSLRKTCNRYRPYSNCVTLRGQLTNWTSEDIVKVATQNIETIIDPIKDEIGGETKWEKLEVEKETEIDGIFEFGHIGDSLNKDESDKNNTSKPNKEQSDDYEWVKL
jgi:hypothetical protein